MNHQPSTINHLSAVALAKVDSPSTILIDTHCHLNDPKFAEDLPEVLRRVEDAGVAHVICAGYDLESSINALQIAREVGMVSATVGVHPHDAKTFTPTIEEQIREMAANREYVAAIGEAGLDYHYDHSPRDIQQKVFRRHIVMAHELDLPLVVHSREASADVLSILREEGMPPRGVVMHCLPSDHNFAHGAIEMGCFVGIAGPITFQNARHLREIVTGLPLDRLLLETDSPYLTPHPHRGKRNEPTYIPIIAQQLAEIRGLTFEEIAETTTANAYRFFGKFEALNPKFETIQND